MYLFEDEGSGDLAVSFEGCPKSTEFDEIYSNSFLRQIYSSLARDTQYNLTLLASSRTELISPVVDCSSSAIELEDGSFAQTFFLTQFGLVTDYDSYRVFKGMQYASADGIYSSGFVIANGRFLVATSDILAIVITKLLRIRVRNIYVYDVDGHTVQEMARLLYPDTLSFSDLLHLNVAVLS
ncbi:hypothetical protein P43SY_004623 [Pythium insidiosum]|uniref:Uncharacterized protein n=1 Tax=Pythium insidiosum TaxID=114742 RepID=A0AAD5LB86_PYTIN|nr:hypothetical protein P43SY_004623 [Pythium insidiosum]